MQGNKRRPPVRHYGDPAEHLAELFSVLRPQHRFNGQAGPRLSMLAQLWFDRGVLLALREGRDLGVALGLSAAGTRKIGGRLLMIKRNSFIAEAADYVALNEDVSDWKRCKRLVPLVKKMDGMWSQWKRLPAIPDNWSQSQTALYNARLLNPDGGWKWIPCTAQGLLNAVNESRAYALENSPMTMLARLL